MRHLAPTFPIPALLPRVSPSSRLLAGTALGLFMAGLSAVPAAAQQVQPPASVQAPPKPEPTTNEADTPAAVGGSIQLPAVTVEGAAPPLENTQASPVGVNRLPGTVQDTPQAINVITQQEMRQQGVTTLDQALRNVPGITQAIGEGGGGMNGDQFRIRGLEAKGDIYTDGLRDFGIYNRDSFNYEEIQVLKGPSATAFGRGTSGGAILTSTKTPMLEQFGNVTGSGGNGPFGRGTIDYNQPIGDTTAVRLNLMIQNSESVSRDFVESERWGMAPTIGFGLGTDTTFTLGYMHQEDNRVPDFGIPTLTRPGTGQALPASEFGVDSENWYGTTTDSDNSTVDALTARFFTKARPWLDVSNDTRLGYYDRFFTPTAVACNAACLTAFFDGNPATEPLVNRGGPGPFDQNGWGVQNITTAVAKFQSWGIRHEAVGGLDVSFEHDSRKQFVYSPNRPTTSLLNPDPTNTNGFVIIPSAAANARKTSENANIGLFANDRIWFTPEWSVLGGLRVDRFVSHFETSGPTTAPTEIEASSTLINPKASVIFEPTDQQTYYVSYARSARPQGEFSSQAPNALAANTSDLDPEEHEIYEVGGKIGVLNNQMGLSASVFQINKNNAKEVDETTGTIVASGDEQRVRGIELGATGRLTRQWSVTANYIFLDAETTASTTAANVGKQVQFVAEHAASLWTTYDVLPDLTVGLGMTYQDDTVLNANNTGEIPSQVVFDAMASYQLGDVRFAVNVYNLFEELHYTQLFGNRVIPNEGRTVIFTTGFDF